MSVSESIIYYLCGGVESERSETHSRNEVKRVARRDLPDAFDDLINDLFIIYSKYIVN